MRSGSTSADFLERRVRYTRVFNSLMAIASTLVLAVPCRLRRGWSGKTAFLMLVSMRSGSGSLHFGGASGHAEQTPSPRLIANVQSRVEVSGLWSQITRLERHQRRADGPRCREFSNVASGYCGDDSVSAKRSGGGC